MRHYAISQQVIPSFLRRLSIRIRCLEDSRYKAYKVLILWRQILAAEKLERFRRR